MPLHWHENRILGDVMLNILRGKVIEPLYEVVIGSPKRGHWQQLEKNQWLPLERQLEMQWQRLSALLNYAYRNNAFYRERFEKIGIVPADIKKPEDMAKLPVLKKKDVRAAGLRMLSNRYRPENLLKFKTGGSTGKSLEVYITEECSEMRSACARRHSRWAGWEPGEPVGAVWGNPEIPRTVKERLKSWLVGPTIYLDTMNVSEDSVKSFASEWSRVKPTLLFGHAHSLYVLAQYIRDLSINDVRPKGIVSSSMMLLPHERRYIEEVFGIKVFDRYGCEELSLIAAECEKHNGMHLNVEHLFIEFLREDDTWVQPGGTGRIAVTDLINRAMPFIRYEIEDVGVPSDRMCTCGRGSPLMESVTGRTADFLVRRDGSRVAGVSLIENTLTKIPGIIQMQIIQESLDVIRLKVVKDVEFGVDQQRTLLEYFKELFGKETVVHLEAVNEIKPEKSGKYRFSICKLERSN